jgi:DNA end-binding protein Ku
MWKGSISFGLVNIPVKMFAATEDKDIKFRYLHKECSTPIKYKKICPTCNREVNDDEIVRGYEYEPEHFVILNEEDFSSVKSAVNSKSIDIIDFVKLSDIDPVFFDKSYYLSPQETGSKAYNLLRKSLEETNKIAVSKMTIRNKQSLAVVRVYKGVLVLETIFYPDEVRGTNLLEGLPENVDVDKKELDIAKQLIDSLTAEFNPESYKDEYREAMKTLIEEKIQGKEVKVAPKENKENVIDLMEALKLSLNEVKKEEKVPSKKKKTSQKKTTAS